MLIPRFKSLVIWCQQHLYKILSLLSVSLFVVAISIFFITLYYPDKISQNHSVNIFLNKIPSQSEDFGNWASIICFDDFVYCNEMYERQMTANNVVSVNDKFIKKTFDIIKNRQQKILSKLGQGRLIYNRITEMWRGKPETVVFKISAAKDEPLSIPEVLTGESIMKETPISSEMSVELIGTAGLEVKNQTTSRQNISDFTSTIWQWKVTPNRGNSVEVLTLRVLIHLSASKDAAPVSLKIYEDEVQVKTSTWQKVASFASIINPIWVFLAGSVPAIWGGMMFVRNRSWRSPKPTPSPPRQIFPGSNNPKDKRKEKS